MNQNTAFYRFVNSLIRIMLAGALFLLLLHSLFSTAFLGKIVLEDGTQQERTLNIADSPLRHFFLFIICSATFFLARRLWQVIKDREPFRWTQKRDDLVFWGMLLFTFAAGTVYVLVTQLEPGSDPAKVFAVAMQWRQGDFSAFEEGGYLFRYPFQVGIILYFYLLSFLFGAGNYVAVQVVNVFCLAVIYGLLAKLADFFWPGKGLRNLICCGLLIWTPLAFFVTYLYGILPGMALSLGAVWFAARYFSTRRYRYIALSSLCMGAATVLKMNCLVWMIAIACFLVYDIIDHLFLTKEPRAKKWAASLLFLFCLAGSVILCNWCNNRIVERIVGQELPEGIPMISWVVMGLQDAPMAPGTYNGYICDVYEESAYDTEKAVEATKQEIKKTVKDLVKDPLDKGIPFFARKTAFQWNDPTFLSLICTRDRDAAVNIPTPLKSLIYGKGSVRFSLFLNDMQTLIWMGALLYVLLRWNSQNLYELMGTVVFLGGYLFHLFWESGASYTLPYFAALLPYAVCGMAEWVGFMERGLDRLRGTAQDSAEKAAVRDGESSVCDGAEKVPRHSGGPAQRGRMGKLLRAAAVAVFCLLVIAFTRTNLFDRTIALNDDLQGIDARDQYYQRGIWETGD